MPHSSGPCGPLPKIAVAERPFRSREDLNATRRAVTAYLCGCGWDHRAREEDNTTYMTFTKPILHAGHDEDGVALKSRNIGLLCLNYLFYIGHYGASRVYASIETESRVFGGERLMLCGGSYEIFGDSDTSWASATNAAMGSIAENMDAISQRVATVQGATTFRVK